jgi:hypothetical protein
LQSGQVEQSVVVGAFFVARTKAAGSGGRITLSRASLVVQQVAIPSLRECRIASGAKVKPFTLLPITSRLSCCLKLTSFTVLSLDGAKTRITGGRLNMVGRVCAPNPQAALDRHGRRSGTGIGATKRVAVPAYGNRNRWSVGDGLTLRCKLPGVPWLLVTLLIVANELCIGQHVAPHCSLDLRFRRAS